MTPENPSTPKPLVTPPANPGVPSPASEATADPAPSTLTPEEQMALFEKELKETDWGHQPC